MKVSPIFPIFFLIYFLLPISVVSQQTAEDFYRQGVELAKKGKFAEAIAAMDEAIKNKADYAEAYLERSRYKSNNQRDLQGAYADVGTALQINPQFAEAYFIRSRIRFTQNLELLRTSGGMNDEDFLPYVKKELEDLNSAIDYGYKNKEVYLIRGDVYSRSLHDSQKAIEDYTAALNFDPKDAMILNNRANVRQTLGDFAGAYEDILQASRLAPNNIYFQKMLASILAKLGNSEKSLEQINKLIQYLENLTAQSPTEKKPDNFAGGNLPEMYRARAGIFHARHDEAAEFADLAKFVETANRDFAYRLRAKIYADHDMFGEAVADFTQALKMTEYPAILFWERGNVYFEMKKYDEASSDYRSAAAKDSGFQESAARMVEQIEKIKNKSKK